MVLERAAEIGAGLIAAWIEDGAVTLVKRPSPALRPGWVRIRVSLAGICNTDLELRRGYYGFRGVPGHEFVGVVTEGPAEWIGRRVTGEINIACGRCNWCARDLGRHCPKRSVLGIVRHPGAFAEFVTLPVENLHKVPDQVPDDVAVFTEPVAAACEVLDQVKIPGGGPVAVLGDGKLGLLIGQVLIASGAAVHQFGRHPEKLRMARRWGAGTPKRGRDASYGVVVDATGSAAGLEEAVRLCRPRGTVVMKSTVHERVGVDMARVIVPEITLVGSRCGRFAPALRLLRTGKVDPRPLIVREYTLGEVTEAFAHAEARGTLKILVRNP